MWKVRIWVIAVLSTLIALPVHTQNVQVNRANKTIQVSITETVRVNSEIAEVKLGYRNFGSTKEAVYEENVRMANRIVQALLEAGVPKEAIESTGIQVDRSAEAETSGPSRKEREFAARQTWTIRAPASEAQKVVDRAVRAGANVVEDVAWTVADPSALEAKANAAALSKARALGAEMAQKLGARLGDLLFVSNSEPSVGLTRQDARLETFTFVTRSAAALQLFPARSERSATVTAIFALE